MIAQGNKIGGGERRAGGFQMCRWYAGGQIDPQVHHQRFGAIEKIPDALGADDVGDLMWIADHGGDAVGQDAGVEILRRQQGGFDVGVRVDEPRHDDLAGGVDLARTGIAAESADDGVAGDCDVRFNQIAGGQIKKTSALQHQICFFNAPALIDAARQRLPVHGRLSCWQQARALSGRIEPFAFLAPAIIQADGW